MTDNGVKAIKTSVDAVHAEWECILAGPGTGKSSSIGNRIVQYVEKGDVAPDRILVLSFTSMAVKDLRKDILSLDKNHPGLGLHKVTVSTLHALALKQLNEVNKNFRLMHDFEVKTMLRDLEPDIGKSRGKMETLRYIDGISDDSLLSNDNKIFKNSKEEWLRLHGGLALMLENLMRYMCDNVLNNADVKKRLSFDWVIVDEYQDLNDAEQKYVELLTAENGKLTVMGDDAQSIYGFKGAHPKGIREFVNVHGCKAITLSTCWRCPKKIVRIANRLLEKIDYENYKDKELQTDEDFQDGDCIVISADTPDEEINMLCEKIKEECDNNSITVAVLSPTKSRGYKLYNKLKEKNINVEFCYRGDLLENKNVCKCVSYMTLASNPNDMISWRYLIGEDRVDRHANSYSRIIKKANKAGKTILEVLEHCANNYDVPYTKALIKRYSDVKVKLDEYRNDPKKMLQLFSADETEYSKIINDAIDEGINTRDFDKMRRAVFAAAYSQQTAGAYAGNRVKIMSLHAAKGLSARLIVIMSAVNDMIPLKGAGSEEEQRRLFYVAITRCKRGDKGEYAGKVLIGTYKHSENGTEKKPSQFIKEMGIKLSD